MEVLWESLEMKIFDQISKKELAELLPGAFKYDEEKDNLSVVRGDGKYRFLLDENNAGLKQLAEKLGVPVRVSYKENPHYKGENPGDKELVFLPETE